VELFSRWLFKVFLVRSPK